MLARLYAIATTFCAFTNPDCYRENLQSFLDDVTVKYEARGQSEGLGVHPGTNPMKKIYIALVGVIPFQDIAHSAEVTEGTVIEEYYDVKGESIGSVKFFGNHQWKFYDATGRYIRTIDDRGSTDRIYVCLIDRSPCDNPASIKLIDKDGSK
jgi:hypothetical protein